MKFCWRIFSRLVFVVLLTIFCILCLKWYFGISQDPNDTLQLPVRCKSEPIIEKMQMDLLQTGHKILTGFNVTHFLCYSTLWAALRRTRLFPWRYTVEMCMISDNFHQIDELYFQRAFTKLDLAIDYYGAEGVYKIWPLRHNAMTSRVQLHLFLFMTAPEHKIVRRVGIKYRLLPALMENIDNFPLRLIAKPLNEAQLNQAKFPVPREGFEIQKYHYKDNWWKEVVPAQCTN